MIKLTICRLLAISLCVIGVAAGVANGQARDADVFFDSYARGAVAADHAMASSAGAQMLAKGGNAVDAAVAASFTLSVVRPYSCGIGGGGFMVIHLPDDPTHGYVHTAVNYRETSPYDKSVYASGLSMTNGRLSVAVPGTVAGLLYTLEKYGTLDRETVLAPAIAAAVDGFVVDDHYMLAVDGLINKYTKNPSLQSSHMSYPWEKFALWGRVKLGDRIKNPEQARALGLIARDGLDAWTGEIGRAVVKALNHKGGTMTLEDLASYEVLEMEPIEATIAGRRLVGMPPPSSGGVTMFETLAILEAKGYDFDDPSVKNARVHLMIESLKHAFADRSRYLADPAFSPVPTVAMLDPANIDRMAGLIDDHGHEPEYYGTHDAIPDDDGTSHLSVVDQWGGGVGLTETINFEFGSRVGVEEFGFILNNEMDDFTHPNAQPNGFGLVQSDRNMPEIGKRPLSSMSPTIMLDEDGNILAIAGASGGPRIITGTMQVLLNVMAGMDAGQAVAAPRFHHQWMPNEVLFEEGYSIYILNVLGNPARGYKQNLGRRNATVANVQVIMRSEHGWQAASDPRKGGRPSGID